MDTELIIKNILLVEDDAGDVELTLAALEENHLGFFFPYPDRPSCRVSCGRFHWRDHVILH